MADRSVFVAAGNRGARKRWGPRRLVRLDALDPVTRGIIDAIVTARANMKADPEVEPGSATEVRRARVEAPSR